MRKLGVIFIAIALTSCGSEGVQEETITDDETERVIPENAAAFGDQLFLWKYEDEFNDQEKEKLEKWIVDVGDATIRTIGQFPFDVEVYFHRNDNERPVSFGHTDRGKVEGVHFYVNPSFTYEELMEDWTAPHEISHLSLPFSGPRTRWFSEGYATYLSRRIMIDMGYYTDESFDSLYRAKIHSFMPYYGSSTKTHLEVSDSLMDSYNYGHFYWGSSSFFLTADSLLQINHNMRFDDVVAAYQTEGRMEDKVLQDVMNSYDAIIDDTLFNGLMYKYRNWPSAETMAGY